jgi:predicted RNase H-like HicB family nuclease
MNYQVCLEKNEEGFSVWCPGLPGCWSQGETEVEALENIKDAIKTYLLTVNDLLVNQTFRSVEIQL